MIYTNDQDISLKWLSDRIADLERDRLFKISEFSDKLARLDRKIAEALATEKAIRERIAAWKRLR